MASVTNHWTLTMMQHDPRLRAAARAIYDACYPSEEWGPLSFAEAERYATVQYRQAVDGVQAAGPGSWYLEDGRIGGGRVAFGLPVHVRDLDAIRR